MSQQLNFVDFHIAQTISNDDPIKQTFSAIDWQLVAKLAPKRSKKGRKSYDFVSMIKAMLLIPLGEARGINNLHKCLREKPRLAFLCGFSFGTTPSASTLSDFINKRLIPNDTILRVFHSMVAQLIALAKVRSVEIAIDGTHLSAQRNDTDARWGLKTRAFSFFGYKVILVISVSDPLFPIAVEVVPGNESETPQFTKVVKQFKQFHPDVKVRKVFGDPAFDSKDNFRIIIKDLAAKPYVGINPRARKDSFITKEVNLDTENNLCCFGGQRLVYWGMDEVRKRVKYRCPIAVNGGRCLFAPLCSPRKYGRSFYIGEGEEFRLLGIALSGSKCWKKEYQKKRAKIEAENGILKNNRGMKHFYFRRYHKVRCFVLLCCLGEVAWRITLTKGNISGQLGKRKIA